MPKPRGPRPSSLTLSPAEQQALETLINRHSTPQQVALRARLILAAGAGMNNGQIARRYGVTPTTARLWRQRWLDRQHVPLEEERIADRLQDAPRPGTPARITPEQWCQLVALVCEVPVGSERPISHWTPREIADEAVKRGIVERLSPRHVGRFLKGDRPAAAPHPLLAEPAAHGTGSRAGSPDPGSVHRLSGSARPRRGGRTDAEYRRNDRGPGVGAQVPGPGAAARQTGGPRV